MDIIPNHGSDIPSEGYRKAMNEKRTAKAREIAIAALHLFADKGYGATSIEEIATAASIGKSTIYEYYATKETLFLEAIMMGADILVEELQAIGRDVEEPMEQLRRISGLMFKEEHPEFVWESKLFIEVLSQTLLSDGKLRHMGQLLKDVYQKVVRIVTDFLLAGVSRGQLRPEIARDAETIAINYLAYLDGIKIHHIVADNLINARNQINFHLKYLMSQIEAPLERGNKKISAG